MFSSFLLIALLGAASCYGKSEKLTRMLRGRATLVLAYDQCGGTGWTGPTICVSGYACAIVNTYYSQCRLTPPPNNPALPAVAPYGQCGGSGYTGSTSCTAGWLCFISNPYYSQCLQEAGASTSTSSSTSTVASATKTTASTTKTTASVTASTTKTTASTTASTTSSTTASATKASPSVVIITTSSSTSTSTKTSTSTSSTTTTSTAAATTTSVSVSGWLGGLNIAGFDFGCDTTGTCSGGYVAPPTSQVTHFTAEGVNVIRCPFGWQYMQSSGLSTTINAGFFSQYNTLVQAVISAGATPILDLHNYARWNGGIVGQGGPTNSDFENIWTQLATYYAGSRVIFGLMNEPYSLDMTEWAATCQGAINAIRAAGATSQIILIPGTDYTSVGAFPDDSYSYLAGITDPSHSGSTALLYFDVHQYLDATSSGTATTCTTNGVSNLETLNSLLAGAGRYAFLSETGGGSTSSCETDLGQELAYIKSAGNFKGFTAWAAGSFATDYALALTPNSDGSDQPIWTDAIQPYL